MKIRKIVLCNLPLDGELQYYISPPYFLKDAVSYPPLGLLYIAAQIYDAEVKLIDTSCNVKLTIDDTARRIIDEKPDILGITGYSIRAYALKTICEKVSRELGDAARIVVGGNHTELYPIETLRYPGVNYVLKGEADYTFPQLVKAIDDGEKEGDLSAINGLYFCGASGQIQANDYKEASFNLDGIPFPRRDLVDFSLYSTLAQDTTTMTSLVSSRGCSFKCIFCDVPIKKIRFRSPENVVEEIEEMMKMGVNEFSFFDDCFNVDPNRVVRICRLIIERKLNIKWCCRLRPAPFTEEMAEAMAASGCNRLHFGVESTNNDILRYMRKGITYEQSKRTLDLCKKYKLKPLIYLMFGFPGEDMKMLKEGEKLILNELRPDYIFPSILFPLGGTVFYRQLLTSGKLKYDFWADYINNPTRDYKVPKFRTPEED
ncbi:MAG: B12-binding domain-containing radical SAM protein, partial [Candidatus Omnitrophica bacterium]|nr:B12-binding domain-containing radical SAM protein [Candidatus Omnitrophota bacterium]